MTVSTNIWIESANRWSLSLAGWHHIGKTLLEAVNICQWHSGSWVFMDQWLLTAVSPLRCTICQRSFPPHMVERANNMFKQHAIRHPEHACHSWNSTAADSEAREPAGIWLQLACVNTEISKQPESVYPGLNIKLKSVFSVAWGLASCLYRDVRGNDVVEGDLEETRGKLLHALLRPVGPSGPAKILDLSQPRHDPLIHMLGDKETSQLPDRFFTHNCTSLLLSYPQSGDAPRQKFIKAGKRAVAGWDVL